MKANMPENAQDRAGFTYTAAADFYDASPLGFSAYFGRRTIELASLPSGSRVLDVCRGTGASALPTAEAIGPTGNVVGVDLANACNTSALALCFCARQRENRLNGFSNTSESTPMVLIRVYQMFTRLSAGRTIAEPSGTLKAF